MNSVIPTTFDEDDNSLYGETEDDDSLHSDDSAILMSNSPASLNQQDKQESNLAVSCSVKPGVTSDSTTTTIKDTPKTTTNTTTTKLRPRSASDSNYRGRREFTLLPESNLKREYDRSPTITPIKKTRVCPCTVKGEQYAHVALNETYPGTVEAMLKLLFDSSFLKNFLERYENFENVQAGIWQHGTREIVGQRRIKSSTSGKCFIFLLSFNR